MRRWKIFAAALGLVLCTACQREAAEVDEEASAGDESTYDTNAGPGGHEPIATEGTDPSEGAMPTTGEE